jgi:hypothetical protein
MPGDFLSHFEALAQTVLSRRRRRAATSPINAKAAPSCEPFGPLPALPPLPPAPPLVPLVVGEPELAVAPPGVPLSVGAVPLASSSFNHQIQ